MRAHSWARKTHAALESTTIGGNAAMIWHDWSVQSATRARFRGFQYLGTRSDHDSGPRRPSRRGLRSLAVVPREVLSFRPQISPLPGAAGRSGRLSQVRGAIADR